MIGIVDVAIQAENPSMPLFPLCAFEGSPSSIRIRNVPKKIGNWNITRVFFSVLYPDGSIRSMECVKSGRLYVGTVEGCDTVGKVDMGYSVFAYGIDEHGDPVVNYCLGKGDVQILDASGLDHPIPVATLVKLCEDEPEFPNDGDMWQGEDGKWYIYQDGVAVAIGGDYEDEIEELDQKIDGVQDDLDSTKSEIADTFADVESEIATKADASTTYSKTEVDDKLLVKADASALEQLSGVVDAKADKSEVTALATVVSAKADASDLSSLATVVSAKANQSDLNALATVVSSKADASDLASLATVVSAKANQSDLNALATVVSSKANASDLALKQDALNATQLSAVNSGIDSNKVNAIEDWKFPSVTKTVVPQEPIWEYDIDQTQWIVASDPVYIDVNVWRVEVNSVQSGTTFYASATGPEYPNTLEFSSDNPQMSFTATTTWYQSVVCDMYKVNQMVVSDSNRSLALVGILNETSNRRGDLWLVVDATNLPNDIPFVCNTYGYSFFPLNDSEDFYVTSGKTNIFHIEETKPTHFVVEKTIQAMDKIGYAPKLKLGEEAKWLPQGFHWGLTETLAQDMTYSASYTSQDQYGRYWWVGQYENMPNTVWDWSVICFDPSENTLDGWTRDMEEELPENLSDLLAVLGTLNHVRLDLSTVSWNDP